MTKGVKLWVSCQEEYLESCARKFFSVQLSHLIYLRYSWKVLPLLPSLPTHAKAGLQARQAPLITQRANTSEWCGAAGANFQILTLPQEEMVMIKNNNNKIYRRGGGDQPNETQLASQWPLLCRQCGWGGGCFVSGSLVQHIPVRLIYKITNTKTTTVTSLLFCPCSWFFKQLCQYLCLGFSSSVLVRRCSASTFVNGRCISRVQTSPCSWKTTGRHLMGLLVKFSSNIQVPSWWYDSQK